MQKPYEELGEELRSIRQKQHKSVAEVSGAVEIDIDALEKIEIGQDRPSEDLLMLLINHFDIVEDEALELWQLAGYYDPTIFERTPVSNDLNKSVVVMMALDNRVLYSDEAQVNIDSKGLIVDFLQSGGPSNQKIPVARIGMSHEQAKDLLRTLHQAIISGSSSSAPKRLSAPKSKKITKSKQSRSQK